MVNLLKKYFRREKERKKQKNLHKQLKNIAKTLKNKEKRGIIVDRGII